MTVPTFWLCGSSVFGSPLADQRTVRAGASAAAAQSASAAAKAAPRYRVEDVADDSVLDNDSSVQIDNDDSDDDYYR